MTVADPAALEAALTDDPTVTAVERLGAVDNGGFYRMQVTDAVETVLYPAWVELGGEGLEAHYEDGHWHSRIRFPDRGALGEYQSSSTENGLTLELVSIFGTTPVDESTGPNDGLTDDQRETLLLAYERGFFDIPRRATAHADRSYRWRVSREYAAGAGEFERRTVRVAATAAYARSDAIVCAGGESPPLDSAESMILRFLTVENASVTRATIATGGSYRDG